MYKKAKLKRNVRFGNDSMHIPVIGAPILPTKNLNTCPPGKKLVTTVKCISDNITCPLGKVLNPDTGRCVSIDSKLGMKLLNTNLQYSKGNETTSTPKSPYGKVINPNTGRYVNATGPTGIKIINDNLQLSKKPDCPDGKVINPNTGRCVSANSPLGLKILNIPDLKKIKKCEDGKVINKNTGRCIKVDNKSNKSKVTSVTQARKPLFSIGFNFHFNIL